MDYFVLLVMAKEAIEKLSFDTEFLLKDLFEGAFWKGLQKGDRLGLGKCFKNEVINNKIKNVQYLGKAENNSAKYRKTKQGEINK